MKLKRFYLLMLPMILSLGLVACSDDDDNVDPVIPPSGSIMVDDDLMLQDGTLTINSVSMSDAGWVVIHRDNDGAPMVPEIISVPMMVEEGTTANVVIELEDGEVVQDGETLWVMLHTDDGQIGVYEFNGTNGLDAPIMNEAGNIVTESFTVTVDMLTVSDQALIDNSITVQNVNLDMDGWVVIHASNEAGDGPMVPEIISEPEYVEAGSNSDVVVTFSEDANVSAGDTVWVMLHEDTGTEGVYEFDGSNGLDLPISDEDGVVVVPVTLQ
ncbi:DUF7282 domain-containing protein [Salinimicrobium terrae]|uniref:DUF7282 domain-containing protein n=1 Tax=Salinimicrobium terrae TaxID=470866 RepID=UPI000412C629|nr:hypothetical protein [Salinimicrobium terrae]